MKTAIVYYSKHHGNTKKLIDAIAAKHEVTLIDATQTQSFDLREYDLIGFASCIYYSKFHKTVLEFAQKNLPGKKSVFFLYTYGGKMEGYTKAIRESVLEKSAQIKGAFGCPGFNTFGPFKLVGGIAKGHPDSDDIARALSFFENLIAHS